MVPKSNGFFIVELLHRCASDGLDYVYLRNYENLPDSIGNDVDLLVLQGHRRLAADMIRKHAEDLGWKLLRIVEHSCLSLFLVNSDTLDLLHIDVSDRLEWHWLEYANPKRILSCRRFNGLVFVPATSDELYLNITTRLIYQGRIREKHRRQVDDPPEFTRANDLPDTFAAHLGSRSGRKLANLIFANDWDGAEKSRFRLLETAFFKYGLCQPHRFAIGIVRYLGRIVRRIIRPSGLFVALEGVDGVGKSTILPAVEEVLQEATGHHVPLIFHWKPQRKSFLGPQSSPSPPQDPRAKPPRPRMLSVIYLAYHWLGFWGGWLRWILPARIRGRAVIADRYVYDLVFDPQRFRLQVPEWILKEAVATTPRPDRIIGLVADAKTIRSRKAELPISEINLYQNRLREMAANNSNILLVDADDSPETVSQAVRRTLLHSLLSMW